MGSVAETLVRWRWGVILAWVVAGFFAFRAAPRTPALLNTRGGSRHPTEASRADSLIRTRFPEPLSEYFAVTVQGPDRLTDAPGRTLIDSLAEASRRLPYVRDVLGFGSTNDSMFASRDGHTAFFVVALQVPTSDSAGALVQPYRDALSQAFDAQPGHERYTIQVTGRAPLDVDIRNVSAQDSARSEQRLLPLTLVILVLAFGALVAAVLPLVVGFLAIAVTLAIVGVLAHHIPMSVFVLNMTSMIGLGVGIDYSLLVVTRFREELTRGLTRTQAAASTLRTAGTAVITSGLTVVVGFAALLFTPLIETQSVGIGGLVVVVTAVLLATTLLPALLAVFGRQIDRPRWLARRLAWYHAPAIWEQWARSLARHPRRALTLGGLGVALLTAPVVLIHIGLPSRNWWPLATEAGRGVQTLQEIGAAGVILPVRVVVEFPPGRNAVDATSLRGLMQFSDSLRADGRVADVRSIVSLQRSGGSLLGYSMLYSDLPSARAQYGTYLDAYLSTDARVTLLDVLVGDTTSLTATMDLVRRTRALAAHPPKGLRGASILVGGYQAASVDFQDDLLARFPLMVLMILGSTGLMLAIAFKSLLVPVKAVIMNTLSVSATFGVIVLVFQYGYGSRVFGLDGPADAIFVAVPVLVFAVVFGLSMDYEVFLLARIKEAFDTHGRNSQATMEGLSATASTITSAALIMILVFGVFAFARVLVVQFLGFGLAVAVLLDATLIRMVLVPAFMHLAGRWNWWPGVRRRPVAPPRPEPPAAGA
ncbi:MAG TPA: MMPL family transporter [Gemmatimonadales bacterium]|nr:MMPL family transporter [Gemmatimonadales bacterium]